MTDIIYDFLAIELRRRELFGRDWMAPPASALVPTGACSRCLGAGWVLSEKGGRVVCATCNNPENNRTPDPACKYCGDDGWVFIGGIPSALECPVCANPFRKAGPKP